MLPVLGGLLSFNVAMADSIVPTMADKQAHSNVRLIRLVMDADARESSGRLPQIDAPEQEQWMADTPSQSEEYDEVDLAKYVPLIQSSQPTATPSNQSKDVVVSLKKKRLLHP